MVTGRSESPKGILRAPGGEQDGIILRRIERTPNPLQSARLHEQWVLGHVPIVIPNETRPPNGLIRKNDRAKKRQGRQPGA
ncbi:MAG: hypothetical protein C5B50_23325 [Verrucomicrobia bacterium]|nr:MAG: hypothetical protein C5B50_23325 [Verrucomicrobiota bacterium]